MKSYMRKSSAGKPIMVSMTPMPAGRGMAQAACSDVLEEVAGGVARHVRARQRLVDLRRGRSVPCRPAAAAPSGRTVEGGGVLAEDLAPPARRACRRRSGEGIPDYRETFLHSGDSRCPTAPGLRPPASMPSSSALLGKLAPYQQLRAAYSLGRAFRTHSIALVVHLADAAAPASPSCRRSSCCSIGATQAQPDSVRMYFSSGKRS